jgi:hypothetical protein
MKFTFILIIGLGLRLMFAFGTYGNADMTSFETVAAIMERGGNVYAETPFYNYSPIWMHVIHVVNQVQVLPFNVSIRLVTILADLIVALLIARFDGSFNVLRFALYWLNPLPIGVTGYGGQFDVAAIALLLVALMAYRDGRRERTIWLLVMSALLVKHSIAFAAWMFFVHAFGWRKAFLYMAACVLVFGVMFIPYLPAGFDGILNNVVRYSWRNDYGFASLLPHTLVSIMLYTVQLLVLPYLMRRRPLMDAMMLSAVGWTVFMPGFTGHYFLLPIVFGTLQSDWKAYALGLIVAPTTIPVYSQWWLIKVFGWSLSGYWLARLMLNLLRGEKRLATPRTDSRTAQLSPSP